MSAAERLGSLIGQLFSVPAYLGGRARRARVLHPRGETFVAEVTALDVGDDRVRGFARRFEGKALVRLSGALRRRNPHGLDVLGVAIRFGWRESDRERLREGHQDLLVATIKHVFTLPFAFLTTQVEDYFANNFFSISPFSIDGRGRVKFRMVPYFAPQRGTNRFERLHDRVTNGIAMYELQVKAPGSHWQPLVQIRLTKAIELDQEALRFSPYNAGLGIRPVGFINALRPPAYRASQKARAQARASSSLKRGEPAKGLGFQKVFRYFVRTSSTSE